MVSSSISDGNLNSLDLQFLADNHKQAIFIYEVEQKKFSYFNPTFEQNFKREKAALSNVYGVLQLVHQEDRPFVKEAYTKLLKDKESREIEFRLQLAEQEEKWVCLKTCLLDETSGRERIVGYLEDISETKNYNDYLKKFGNKKNSVLHILSHDLAGPLAMIGSLSGVLSERLKQYQDVELNYLIDLINKTSSHAVLLIHNFTDHEFLETTGVNLIKRRTDIVERVQEIVDQYLVSAKEIGKTFLFTSSKPQIYIEFDDIKLIQAINNIISNALKFTPVGGTISLKLEEKETTVIISVEDTGVGIPLKYHGSLFDKFTNARRPGLNGEPTTGLGMSITKTIVEWHNGQIWFESEENKGTIFYIEIPKE